MIARNASRPEGRNVRDEIRRGEVYIVKQDDEVVGTVSVDDYADPEFWTEADEPKSAFYIHRMIIRRDAAGHGLGAVMLDWAADQAARAGKKWLRLDAWRTNTALHDYYRRHGFADVRTISLPWRGSGELFQRPAQPSPAQPSPAQPITHYDGVIVWQCPRTPTVQCSRGGWASASQSRSSPVRPSASSSRAECKKVAGPAC